MTTCKTTNETPQSVVSANFLHNDRGQWIYPNELRAVKLSIFTKLFIAIGLTTTGIALGIVWFIEARFASGFESYLRDQQVKQVDRFAERLADVYADYGSFELLEGERRLWARSVRELMGRSVTGWEAGALGKLRSEGRPREKRRLKGADGDARWRGERRKPYRPNRRRPPRVDARLLDTDQALIAGPLRPFPDGVIRPIRFDDAVVGYVEVPAVRVRMEPLARAFAEQGVVRHRCSCPQSAECGSRWLFAGAR